MLGLADIVRFYRNGFENWVKAFKWLKLRFPRVLVDPDKAMP
jgi:hypothetical protein